MPHSNQKIFDEGWQAWADGAEVNENPYVNQAGNGCAAWQDGWYAAQEDYSLQKFEHDEYGNRADWEYDRNR